MSDLLDYLLEPSASFGKEIEALRKQIGLAKVAAKDLISMHIRHGDACDIGHGRHSVLTGERLQKIVLGGLAQTTSKRKRKPRTSPRCVEWLIVRKPAMTVGGGRLLVWRLTSLTHRAAGPLPLHYTHPASWP